MPVPVRSLPSPGAARCSTRNLQLVAEQLYDARCRDELPGVAGLGVIQTQRCPVAGARRCCRCRRVAMLADTHCAAAGCEVGDDTLMAVDMLAGPAHVGHQEGRVADWALQVLVNGMRVFVRGGDRRACLVLIAAMLLLHTGGWSAVVVVRKLSERARSAANGLKEGRGGETSLMATTALN